MTPPEPTSTEPPEAPPKPRVPVPHDPEAEEALIGSMLLTSMAVDTATGLGLEPEDFYVPLNAMLYRAMAAMATEGERIDPVTLHAWLRAHEPTVTIDRPALMDLQHRAPASANALQYARVVLEHATRRALIHSGFRIAGTARDLSVSPHDVVILGRELLDRSDVPAGGNVPSPDIVEFLSQRSEYEWAWPGVLETQDRVIFVAAEKAGKALDVDTPILTTSGWATMGTVAVGDEVYAPDGKPVRVLGCSPVLVGRECYAVRFDDGAELVADGEHLWRTVDYVGRQRRWDPQVRTTADMAATVEARGGHTRNHAIECSEPFDAPVAVLPVDPYSFGAWLGDGTSSCVHITSADVEIIERIRAAGWTVTRTTAPYGWKIGLGTLPYPAREPSGRASRLRSFGDRLARMGVLGAKRIPAAYQQASAEQRLELLRGVVDTDGHVTARGQVEITLTNARLAGDVAELVRGLGIKVHVSESDACLNGRVVSRRWRICFYTALAVAALPRKAALAACAAAPCPESEPLCDFRCARAQPACSLHRR